MHVMQNDYGPVVLWLCLIGGASLVIAGITSIWSWANQFFNWKFLSKRYQEKLAEVKAHNKANPKVLIREPKTPKWRRGRAQQIGVLRYGYPWGLLLLASMAYVAYQGFDSTIYVSFGAAWFLLTRLRYSHKIRAIVKLNRKLHEDGQTSPHHLLNRTAREYIQHHYAWGFSEPSFTGKFKKHQKKIYWYYGWAIFRVPVNGLCNATMAILHFSWLSKLFHLRVVLPLIWYGTLALFWPLTGAIAVLCNVNKIMKKKYDTREISGEPWWALDSPEPPYARQLPTNTPPPAENSGSTEHGEDTPEDGRTEFVTKTDTGYAYEERPAQPNVQNG